METKTEMNKPTSSNIPYDSVLNAEKTKYDNSMGMNDLTNAYNNPVNNFSYRNNTNYDNTEKKYNAQQQNRQPEPLLNLQLYQEPKKSNPMANKQAFLQQEPFFVTPFMPPQFQSYVQNAMKNFYTPFIYKDYTINLGGPNGDTVRAKTIYEDALPPPEVFTSYKTLRERNGLCNYIRSNFINIEDGELTDWTGSGSTSLASRLKLTEINQYNNSRYTSNPVDPSALVSKKMFNYRSCYPIINDKSTSTVQCNKNFIGINIRVYNIELKELFAKYLNRNSIMEEYFKFNTSLAEIFGDPSTLGTTIGTLNYQNCNVWRDLEYYEFMREKIHKQYVCPNFVQSYCYFLDRETKFKFDSLKAETDSVTKKKNALNLTGGTLVILTESPVQNIVQWTSNVAVNRNGTTTMTYSGYKLKTHWESIIAQMLIVFYVMDKFQFTIMDMELANNFYIARLNAFGDNKPYWQYNINNIDYYIPNYGHLLMCDHDYKDLDDPTKNKVLIRERLADDDKKIREQIYANAIKCFDGRNVFGSSDFTGIGGVRPEDDVLKIFDDIHDDLRLNGKKLKDGTLGWGDFIEKHLRKYIHNRVGTYIRDLEVKYVNETNRKKFKRGDLVVHKENSEVYKILLYVKDETDDTKANCLTFNEPTKRYIELVVSKDLLYNYSEYDRIKQDFKPGEPYADLDHVIEKYYL